MNIINLNNIIKSLKSKVVLITGATGGLGKCLTENFATAGAYLILLGRSKTFLKSLKQEIIIKTENDNIKYVTADLSDSENISCVYTTIHKHFGSPDILINNAGILGPIGMFCENQWDSWKMTFEVDFFSPILLCKILLPDMINRGSGKIINISGGGAANARPYFSAYSCAKTALVRFSETIAEELKGTGIDINCIAPGILNTKMVHTIIEAGENAAGEKEYSKALEVAKNLDEKALKHAVDLVLFLASSVSDGISGKLISAVWDPWYELPTYMDDLKNSDIYTLKRIIPKDRGKDWGKN